jgi:probable F420-dependent oxidoreductase
MPDITVSVQAQPKDLDSWLALARRLESSGFHALLLADHPGSSASPWPALGAAAAVTGTLRLGTYVSQCGVREPMHVAVDAATLDLLAPGRVILGLGAGHTPSEWQDLGRDRPSPGDRARRLAEFADVVAQLLRGETVTHAGPYLTMNGSRLEGVPADGRVGLLVGGGHPEVLRAGVRHAGIVALGGLGRTLPDGHQHEAKVSAGHVRRSLGVISDEAQRVGRTPVIEALVHAVQATGDRATGDRATALEEIGQDFGVSPADVAGSPFVLAGTPEEMAAQLRAQAKEFGITSYAVREPAVPDLERVLPLLNR